MSIPVQPGEIAEASCLISKPRLRIKKQKNVLLALGWHDHRVLRGIATYAREQDWHISASSMTNEVSIPWGWRGGDGVLTWLAASEELCKFVISLKIPTVDFSLRRRNLPFGHVALDHAETGRMAADHLLRRGMKNFLYYTDEANWTPDERGEAFVNRLAEHGHECQWIKWHTHKPFRKSTGEWAERRDWLLAKLNEQPKPVGIFTEKGALALEVHEVCEREGINVPEDVALIGVEDELLAAQTAERGITTIEPNFEELGYQGAKCLDAMMNGQKPPEAPIRVAPKRINARKSTDISQVSHAGLAKALTYIAKHFSEEIDVETVARHVGMSRRGLHQAFVQHLKRTPGEQLRDARIEYAKKLLIESDNKVAVVARLSGYPCVNSFFIAFARSCGVSPAKYRGLANRGRQVAGRE